MMLRAQRGRVPTTNLPAAMKQRGNKYYYYIGSTTWKGCYNKPCSSNEAMRGKVSRAQHGRVATTNHAAAMKQRGRKYHYDIGSTTWKGCNNKPCSSNEAKREKVSL